MEVPTLPAPVPSGLLLPGKRARMLKRVGVTLVAEGASTFQSAVNNASKLTDNFGGVASKASGGIDKMSVATVALGTALANVATAGLAKIVEGISSFVSSGFDTALSVERATAKLEAFLGSAEAAADAIEMVKKRAAATPFAFSEMANGAASLAGVSKTTGESLESLLGVAESLAASNPMEGLEGAAYALKQAFAGDFLSLQDRFDIPKDVLDRIKEGGITVEELSEALKGVGISQDLVSKLAATTEGRWSTLVDTFNSVAEATVTPVLNAIKDVLADLQPVLDANVDKFKAAGEALGEFAAGGVQIAIDAVKTFIQALQGDWVDSDIINPFHRIVGVAGQVVRAIGTDGLAGAWAILEPYAREGLNRLMAYVEGQLPTWKATLSQWGTAAWEWIEKEAIPPALAKLSEWAEVIKGYAAAQLTEWQGVLEGWATAAWQWIVNSAMQIPQKVTDWVAALLASYQANLPQWTTNFWDWATESVKWLGDAIPDLIDKAGDWLAALVGWFLSDGLPGLVTETDKMQDASVKWIEDAVPLLWPKFVLFMAEVSKSLQKIQEAIGEAAVKIGVAIIAGIISGLLSVAHQIGDALGSVISAEIQRAIQDALAGAAGNNSIYPDKNAGGGTAPKSSAPPSSPNYTNTRVDAPPTSYGSYSSNVSTTNSVNIPITVYGGSGDVAAQVEYGVTRSLRAAGIN